MLIKIGSDALKRRTPKLKRDSKDVDFFSDTEEHGLPEFIEGKPVEVFVHPNLAKYEWSGDVASLDELYTIKVSHLFWDLKNNSWERHMHDVLFFQFRTNAKFIPELYKILYPIWEETHGKKKANLNLSPEDFFNKNVTRIYDHDSIHKSVAYYDEPLFNKILKDGHEVAVDEKKFEALSTSDKFRLVREEIYATALERQVFPSGGKVLPGAAYFWTLKKTITSFSKGWFPLFIVLNLENLYKPDMNFVQYSESRSHMLQPL